MKGRKLIIVTIFLALALGAGALVEDRATGASTQTLTAAQGLTGSGWPDIFVASGLVLLLLRSASRVMRSALAELRAAT